MDEQNTDRSSKVLYWKIVKYFLSFPVDGPQPNYREVIKLMFPEEDPLLANNASTRMGNAEEDFEAGKSTLSRETHGYDAEEESSAEFAEDKSPPRKRKLRARNRKRVGYVSSSEVSTTYHDEKRSHVLFRDIPSPTIVPTMISPIPSSKAPSIASSIDGAVAVLSRDESPIELPLTAPPRSDVETMAPAVAQFFRDYASSAPAKRELPMCWQPPPAFEPACFQSDVNQFELVRSPRRGRTMAYFASFGEFPQRENFRVAPRLAKTRGRCFETYNYRGRHLRF